ncbi:MAG: carboxypeptidase-like regulatory domain-containing protein [Candidatus Angelobacter sp.]
MARAHRTILFALALAAQLAAQNAPAAQSVTEDPPPAIIEGSVINIQNSRTIPRATVTLLHLKGTGSKSQRADGRGHFIFQNVEPGIYRLMADRAGFFSDDRKREYQPIFEIAAGEHVKDIPVRLIPSALLSGKIRDEYNDPVQDAEVRVLAVQTRLGQQYLRVAGKAMTDDRGEYRIAGLHPGKYYLVVEDKSKPLATLTSIIENVNALSKMIDEKGRPLRVDMPGVPDPPYTYAPPVLSGYGRLSAGAKPEAESRR